MKMPLVMPSQCTCLCHVVYVSMRHATHCNILEVCKVTMVATSSNHSKILVLHEASRKCVWLRSMVGHICRICQISLINETPIMLFENNATCNAQIKSEYIKGDRINHISPKFFYIYELQKNSEIDIHHIRSSDNLVNLFTNLCPLMYLTDLFR